MLKFDEIKNEIVRFYRRRWSNTTNNNQFEDTVQLISLKIFHGEWFFSAFDIRRTVSACAALLWAIYLSCMFNNLIYYCLAFVRGSIRAHNIISGEIRNYWMFEVKIFIEWTFWALFKVSLCFFTLFHRRPTKDLVKIT